MPCWKNVSTIWDVQTFSPVWSFQNIRSSHWKIFSTWDLISDDSRRCKFINKKKFDLLFFLWRWNIDWSIESVENHDLNTGCLDDFSRRAPQWQLILKNHSTIYGWDAKPGSCNKRLVITVASQRQNNFPNRFASQLILCQCVAQKMRKNRNSVSNEVERGNKYWQYERISEMTWHVSTTTTNHSKVIMAKTHPLKIISLFVHWTSNILGCSGMLDHVQAYSEHCFFDGKKSLF